MPDEHRDALLALTHADPEVIAGLARSFNVDRMSIGQFREALASALPQSTGNVADALIAFNAWRSRKSQSLEEAMPVLHASLNGKAGETDIQPLFDSRAALLLAKSGDLEYAHATVAENLRIITDIRPLFSDKAAPEILASIITHQLVISVLQDDETRDIYVALDTDDLAQLKAQVHRAQKKDEKVREFLKKSDVAVADWLDVE